MGLGEWIKRKYLRDLIRNEWFAYNRQNVLGLLRIVVFTCGALMTLTGLKIVLLIMQEGLLLCEELLCYLCFHMTSSFNGRNYFVIELVNLTKIAWKEDHFIMSYQAKQVFYVKDPSNERWSVVVQGRIEHDVHPQDDTRFQFVDKFLFSRQIPPLNDENDVDEVHATRHDHNERIWENILTLPQ